MAKKNCKDCNSEFEVKPLNDCNKPECNEVNPCSEINRTTCVLYDGETISSGPFVIAMKGDSMTTILGNIKTFVENNQACNLVVSFSVLKDHCINYTSFDSYRIDVEGGSGDYSYEYEFQFLDGYVEAESSGNEFKLNANELNQTVFGVVYVTITDNVTGCVVQVNRMFKIYQCS
jgi:hypothetical protein